MITLQELLSYFNLAGALSPSQEDFDRGLQIALERFKNLVGYDYPATPSALEKEEGKTRFSIKKVSSAAERIAWRIRASQTRTS